MTSIIGYTRVPFNPSCSIAPVQRLYQLDNRCNDENSRPAFHRIFSREENSQNGIIELIVDKKPLNTINLDSKMTSNSTSNKYNTYLSIDLSGKHDYDKLCTFEDDSTTANFDSIQRLMDSISKLAYEKTTKFVRIIDLLKQLQLYQHKHQFMSCIDKQNEIILVYFPNTLTKTVEQTSRWLRTVLGMNVDAYDHWQLLGQHQEESEQDTEFDGKSYFNDIHLFIDHVDALIESNGLFSHKKAK
jgi:hypothetical protein